MPFRAAVRYEAGRFRSGHLRAPHTAAVNVAAPRPKAPRGGSQTKRHTMPAGGAQLPGASVCAWCNHMPCRPADVGRTVARALPRSRRTRSGLRGGSRLRPPHAPHPSAILVRLSEHLRGSPACRSAGLWSARWHDVLRGYPRGTSGAVCARADAQSHAPARMAWSPGTGGGTTFRSIADGGRDPPAT